MAELTLFHAPNTRSFAALVLLEELGVPYRLHVLDFSKDEQLSPAYLAINPMGKVPALKHGDAVVTEQVAIALYLADLFAEKALRPRSATRFAAPICAGWSSMQHVSNRPQSTARCSVSQDGG